MMSQGNSSREMIQSLREEGGSFLLFFLILARPTSSLSLSPGSYTYYMYPAITLSRTVASLLQVERAFYLTNTEHAFMKQVLSKFGAYTNHLSQACGPG